MNDINNNDFNNNNDINSTRHIRPSKRRNKTRWWIPVSIVLGVIILFFLGIFGIIAYVSNSISTIGGSYDASSVVIQDNSILKLDFSNLSEVKSANTNYLELFNSSAPSPSFYEVIESINYAAEDSRIIGIYYEGAGYLSGAMAKELQIALLNFKKSNKFIYSFLEYSAKSQYYTACVSDSIFIPEEGMYEFTGFSVSSMFLKGLYDKIGIEFTTVQCEDFKTAAETYKNYKFSDSSKLEYRVLVAEKEREFINSVAQARGLDTTQVVEIMNKGIVDSDEMLSLKLADVLSTRQQVIAFLETKCKALPSTDIAKKDDKKDGSKKEISTKETKTESCNCSNDEKNIVSISDYVAALHLNNNYIGNDNIAIICGEGAIVSASPVSTFNFNREQQIVSSDFVKLIKKAKDDDNVKGIILRINSPGGSVIASEEIYQAILDAKKVKPVYASMSDVAASGGYYISMACDTIIAHNNTITGSIGVVAAIPNISKLLSNLHITVDTISNGIGNPYFLDFNLPRNQKDIAAFEKMTFATYQRFLSKAAKSRNMSVEQMRSVAKGRVWLGSDAFDRGLVDVLGNLNTAIDLMQKRLGKSDNNELPLHFMPDLEDPWTAFTKLFNPKKSISFVDLLADRLNKKRKFENEFLLPDNVQTQINYLNTLAQISTKEKVLFAMPSLIEIK
jgi:protease-4